LHADFVIAHPERIKDPTANLKGSSSDPSTSLAMTGYKVITQYAVARKTQRRIGYSHDRHAGRYNPKWRCFWRMVDVAKWTWAAAFSLRKQRKRASLRSQWRACHFFNRSGRDTVTCYAWVEKNRATSMTIPVEVWVERFREHGRQIPGDRAAFSFTSRLMMPAGQFRCNGKATSFRMWLVQRSR